MSPSNDSSERPPTEMFDLLRNETRLAIVLALAELRRTNWRIRGRTFADLRRAVGIRDAGNFSYHLDKLAGHLVVRDGDTYQLTDRGLTIADWVLAGTYGDRAETHTATTDLTCPFCNASITATYENEVLALVCEEHGSLFGTTLPSGAVAGRTMDELLWIASRDAQHDVEFACAGVCFHCWGRMHSSLVVGEPRRHPATGDPLDDPFEERDAFTITAESNEAIAVFGCEQCETVFWIPPGGCILHHPTVASFYYDHGIDVRGMPYLDSRHVESCNSVGGCSVESTDPVQVRVTMVLDDESLCVTLDEKADVVAIDRERVNASTTNE